MTRKTLAAIALAILAAAGSIAAGAPGMSYNGPTHAAAMTYNGPHSGMLYN